MRFYRGAKVRWRPFASHDTLEYLIMSLRTTRVVDTHRYQARGEVFNAAGMRHLLF